MFYIPVENYPKLEKIFGRIKNRGGVLNLVKGEPVVLAVSETTGRADPNIEKGTQAWEMSRKHKFYPIEVEGKYEIPGWRFIATVEHTPNGNIIRNITDEKIPDRYLNSSPECEHCHKIRDRKDTYLVQNTDTGEFKQVGKSCLKSYTGGMDASIAAEMAQWVSDPEEIKGVDDDLFVCSGGGPSYYDADRMKKVAYEYVTKEGYSKDPGYIVGLLDNYNDSYKKENNSRVMGIDLSDIDKWVLNLDTTNNDYYRNAFLAWSLEEVEPRHLKLIASLINTYLKDAEKKKQMELKRAEGAASEFVGNVGDKITLTVASSRVLYYKTFNYGWDTTSTPVLKIVGTDGNTYIWATDTYFLDGDTIRATVKSHNEFNGEKQTTITRGKVIDASTGKPLEKRWQEAKSKYEELRKELEDTLKILYPKWEDRKDIINQFSTSYGFSAEGEFPTKKMTDWFEERIPQVQAELDKYKAQVNDKDKLFLDEE